MQSGATWPTGHLFRSMQEDRGGPLVGATARTLGVRPGTDIVVDGDGLVRPGTEGMSVSSGSPMNLPLHRRPPSLGGTGKDPVWAISPEQLAEELSYRPAPDDETHGFIEPAYVMSFEQYQAALHKTRQNWQRISR